MVFESFFDWFLELLKLKRNITLGIYGEVRFLVVAWNRNLWWFFGCLFVPLVAWVFLFLNLRATLKPFALSLLGLLLAGLGSAVLLASRALPRTDRPTDALIAETRALSRMLAELEAACTISEHTATAVTFTVADRDGDGFIVRHDGSLPDLLYRLGAKYCVTAETTGATPPGAWHAVHVPSALSGVRMRVAIDPWQVTQFGPWPSLRSRA
jgi:hypothetical protein